jgi:Tol biopolymer transport system component
MRLIKNLLTFSLLFVTPIIFGQATDTIQPAANLVVQGISPIPTVIAQSVKKYTEARSASIASWHPLKKEMLITTRFGATNQIHALKMAGGARTQITFYDEPVSTATYEPTQGNYFLFLKDVGGNEFSQIYRYDLKDGDTTLITDGGRTQNNGLSWSNSGKWIAYGSTKRNGADRDIYIMDPLHPETNKLILQVQGGGWSVNDWSKDDKQLLVYESISVNESHLWLVDVATGNKTALTPEGEKNVAYGVAFFSKDGKGIYFTTDKNNEFQRFAYMDFHSKKTDYFTSSINWDIDNADITKDGKQIAFTSNEAGISKLYLFSTATHSFKQIKNIPVGVITALQWHNDNHDLAIGINNAQSPNDIYVLDATTLQLNRWTESELGGMVASELKPTRAYQMEKF